MNEHFGVARRAEDGAALDQRVPEDVGVHQVAVVTDRDVAELALDLDGLDVLGAAVTGRRVARVPDRRPPDEGVERFHVEDIRHMPRAVHSDEAIPVRGCGHDPRGFLPAVLERVEPQIGEARGLRVVPDPHHPALFVEPVRRIPAGRTGVIYYREFDLAHPRILPGRDFVHRLLRGGQPAEAVPERVGKTLDLQIHRAHPVHPRPERAAADHPDRRERDALAGGERRESVRVPRSDADERRAGDSPNRTPSSR